MNSKAIGNIKAIQHLLIHRAITPKSKTLLYASLVRPIMTYTSPAWCTLSKTHLNRLQKTQNYALRLITRSPRYTRIAALHSNVNIPTIAEHLCRLNSSFYLKFINDPNLNPTLISITTRRKRRTTLEFLEEQTSRGPKRPRK